MDEKELKFRSSEPQFSSSAMYQLCDPGFIPALGSGPLEFQ